MTYFFFIQQKKGLSKVIRTDLISRDKIKKYLLIKCILTKKRVWEINSLAPPKPNKRLIKRMDFFQKNVDDLS